MALKRRPPFDPKSFLAMVGEGRGIEECHKDQIVFSQGDPADAVFYIQSGKAPREHCDDGFLALLRNDGDLHPEQTGQVFRAMR
jgi:hypothetical protein